MGVRRLHMLMPFDPVIPIMGINPEDIIKNKVKDGPTGMLTTALFTFM